MHLKKGTYPFYPPPLFLLWVNSIAFVTVFYLRHSIIGDIRDHILILLQCSPVKLVICYLKRKWALTISPTPTLIVMGDAIKRDYSVWLSDDLMCQLFTLKSLCAVDTGYFLFNRYKCFTAFYNILHACLKSFLKVTAHYTRIWYFGQYTKSARIYPPPHARQMQKWQYVTKCLTNIVGWG